MWKRYQCPILDALKNKVRHTLDKSRRRDTTFPHSCLDNKRITVTVLWLVISYVFSNTQMIVLKHQRSEWTYPVPHKHSPKFRTCEEECGAQKTWRCLLLKTGNERPKIAWHFKEFGGMGWQQRLAPHGCFCTFSSEVCHVAECHFSCGGRGKGWGNSMTLP